MTPVKDSNDLERQNNVLTMHEQQLNQQPTTRREIFHLRVDQLAIHC